MHNLKKKSVLIIDNSLDKTGAFKAIMEFVRYAKKDYKFLFAISTKSKLYKEISDEGFEVIQLPFVEISKNLKGLALYIPILLYNAFKLKKVIYLKEIDIIHVNDIYNLLGVALKILEVNSFLITHFRFMPDRFPNLLVRFWIGINLKFSDKIICVSNAVKNQLPNHPKISTVYDTIINEDYETKTHGFSPFKNNVIHLLYPAHYIPGKGQNFALEAFHQAYKQNPNLRLKFVGGDMGLDKNQRFKEELIKEALRLRIADVVEFSGPAYEIKEEMMKVDIILNFSESESFSFICLEALFCGKAIITTDCGGPSEIVDHGETGWIVPNKNVDAMKGAILKLADNEALRLNIAKNGFISVRSKFSVANTHNHLKQLYNIVLND